MITAIDILGGICVLLAMLAAVFWSYYRKERQETKYWKERTIWWKDLSQTHKASSNNFADKANQLRIERDQALQKLRKISALSTPEPTQSPVPSPQS